MPERDSLRESSFEAFARTGDVVLRDQLVAAHMGLAAYLARRFANRGQPLEDLVQVASVGLLKAVDRFDPGLGVEFSTYATTTIVGELKRHLRDQGWAVRAPRRMQELYLSLGQVIDTLARSSDAPRPSPSWPPRCRRPRRRCWRRSRPVRPTGSPRSTRPHPTLPSGDLGERLGREDAELDRAEQRATLDPCSTGSRPASARSSSFGSSRA